MVQTIGAVPGFYRGVRFASRLEVGWAQTLDFLGIEWLYEPAVVPLPSGNRYRPDFYLPMIRTWLEVKGPHDERIEKSRELSVLVAHGPDCSTGRRELPGVACCDRWWRPWDLVVIGRPPAPLPPAVDLPAPFVSAQGPLVLLAFESAVDEKDDIGLGRCKICNGWYFFRWSGSFECRRCGAHDGDGHFETPQVLYVWP